MKSYLGDDGIWYTAAQRHAVDVQLQGCIERGEYVPKKVCSKCGQDKGIIHFHHKNYSHPFAFMVELCWRCHLILHLAHRFPEQAAAYDAQIAAGVKFPPVFSHDIKQLREHGIEV